jgi:flagellar basal-body rod modification protein FlgD
MATSSIDPAAAFAASGLNLNDLLRVLLTELTHQDPFKPVDNKDFMAQVAQFASLDASQQLNTNMTQLLALQALNQSVGLIGREVTAKVDGQSMTGRVTSLTLTDGVPRLTLTRDVDGSVIPNIALGDLEVVNR